MKKSSEHADKAVLLVDDDDDILSVYTSLLTSEGIKVDATTDPHQALKLLSQNVYRVIVTDLRMPTMSGLQLVAYIRANELNRSARIIVVSGAVDQNALMKLNRLRVVEIIEKPFNASTFVKRVTENPEPPGQKPIGYCPELVSLFKDAGTEILGFYLGESLVSNRPSLKMQNFSDAACAAILPIFGRHVFGSMALAFDEIFTSRLARALFPSGTEAVGSTGYFDTAAETLNQIAALIQSRLRERGALIQIGMPRLLVGTKARNLWHPVDGRTMSLPYSSGNGVCHIEVCLGNSLHSDNFEEGSSFKVFLVA